MIGGCLQNGQLDTPTPGSIRWRSLLGKAGNPISLTDVAIRNASPRAKAIKLADGGGMFLLVTPAEGKLWRLKYRIDGRKKLLALEAYPEIGAWRGSRAEGRGGRIDRAGQ